MSQVMLKNGYRLIWLRYEELEHTVDKWSRRIVSLDERQAHHYHSVYEANRFPSVLIKGFLHPNYQWSSNLCTTYTSSHWVVSVIWNWMYEALEMYENSYSILQKTTLVSETFWLSNKSCTLNFKCCNRSFSSLHIPWHQVELFQRSTTDIYEILHDAVGIFPVCDR